MKPLVTLVLVYVLFSEAFQASAALKCYSCVNTVCIPNLPCNADQDCCYNTTELFGRTLKGCTTIQECNRTQSILNTTCCQTDLCNGTEGVKLSLLFMLVPLISSISVVNLQNYGCCF